MALRRLWLASAALSALAVLVLGACGTGGSSSTTTATAPGPNPAGRSRGGGPAAAKPSPSATGKATDGRSGNPGSSSTSEEAIPPALVRKAGRAAPFLAPSGDNSIPTYGSEGSEGEASEAARALAAYLQAREAGNWTTACRGLSGPTRKQLQGLGKGAGVHGGCAKIYGTFSRQAAVNDRGDPFSARFAAFRVRGANAFVLFYGPRGQKYVMPMLREGGRWKVNQMAPIPYPPEVTPAG
jgi:hypothetical protein